MNRSAVVNALVLVVRVALGAILIVAGFSKVGHAAEFAAQIAAFRLLPQGIIGPMAVELPFLEILVGIFLVLGLFARIAGWIGVVMFAAFDGAIASAVVRGMTVSCGCFGPNDKTVTTWAEVARDAVFVVLAVFVALRAPGMLALDRRIRNA